MCTTIHPESNICFAKYHDVLILQCVCAYCTRVDMYLICVETKKSLKGNKNTNGNLLMTPWSTTPSTLSRLSATSAAFKIHLKK